MGETHSKTQLPMHEIVDPGRSEDPFHEGLAAGRELAEVAVRRIGAWAEENPGQVVLAGLAAGFLLGKLLFPRRSPLVED